MTLIFIASFQDLKREVMVRVRSFLPEDVLWQQLRIPQRLKDTQNSVVELRHSSAFTSAPIPLRPLRCSRLHAFIQTKMSFPHHVENVI